MAQTFRPYQSQGIGLNQLNLPQGIEAQEASKTMQVLSQGLNRMSEWAFQQANIQAQEEGTKWGVENAPTLASIKKAQKEGKDTNDLFEFGNTTFGRYARQSALKTLENEVLLTATIFTCLVGFKFSILDFILLNLSIMVLICLPLKKNIFLSLTIPLILI
mgnify:CR=1 FL=1